MGLGPTAEEFHAMMDLFEVKAKEVMAEASHTDLQNLPDQYKPIFSYDNARIHTDKYVCAPRSEKRERALLPPRSPDMHKVIEHIFNYITNTLKGHVFPDMLAALGSDANTQPSVFWDVVEEVLLKYGERHLEGIRKDIVSLDKTYGWIIAHDGQRAPRPLN